MAATLLPMGAFAAETDKAILPGASGISGYDSQNRYDYLYYGQWEDAPIQWRVPDDQTNTGEEGLFVLSEGCLGTGNWGNIPFDDTNPKSNAWQGSDAQAWCNTLYTEHFTAGEQGAVLATTKSDDAYDSTSTAFHPSFVAVENILNEDKVFFLSAQEAETAAYGFTDDASRVARYQNVRNGLWWLRSPLVGLAADSAGYINGGANDDTKLTDYASALVPISLADPYNVWICGTQVTSDNASDVLADGTVTYDPATHTLT